MIIKVDNPIEPLKGATTKSITKGAIETIVAGKLGMALPPYWLKNKIGLHEAGDIEDASVVRGSGELRELVRQNALGYAMYFPLEIEIPGDGGMWTLPFEPLISVSGKNVITRRQVAKGSIRGSIKEYWTQDDYSISIQGVLMNTENVALYPSEDVAMLKSICEARRELKVNCYLLDLFDIRRIVIERFDIPFTRGENAQNFVITAYSDDMYDLLIDESSLNV